MRRKRQGQLCYKGMTASERRAVRREYYAMRHASGGFSSTPETRRRLDAKPAPYAEAWSFRRAHPLHAVGRPGVFRELTRSGQERALALKHGGASRMSRPELLREIADILRTRGISQLGRI